MGRQNRKTQQSGARLMQADQRGTPLHYAVWKGNGEAVDLLLCAGACPWHEASSGLTPLDLAIAIGHDPIARYIARPFPFSPPPPRLLRLIAISSAAMAPRSDRRSAFVAGLCARQPTWSPRCKSRSTACCSPTSLSRARCSSSAGKRQHTRPVTIHRTALWSVQGSAPRCQA